MMTVADPASRAIPVTSKARLISIGHARIPVVSVVEEAAKALPLSAGRRSKDERSQKPRMTDQVEITKPTVLIRFSGANESQITRFPYTFIRTLAKLVNFRQRNKLVRAGFKKDSHSTRHPLTA